jgi:hypothetical protein
VDLLPDLATLSDDALDEQIVSLERDEESVSLRRRMLHGHIDLLRAEWRSRLRDAIDAGTVQSPDPQEIAVGVAEHVHLPDAEADPASELAPLPDPASLGDDALRERIRALEREEDEASLRRRVLHGQIDILRAERELRRRGHTGKEHVEVGQLAEILSERLLARPEDT